MLVGIAGFRSAGKSALADVFVRHGFRKVSPSDAAKRFGVDLGFTEHCMFGSSHARGEAHPTLLKADGSALTGREFLDVVCAEVRKLCPTIFMDRSMRGDGDMVNESLRFAHEWEAVRAMGGKLIRRKGGHYVGDEYDREVAAMPDSYWDAVIDEQPSLDALAQVAAVLLDGWRAEAGR
jgi:hypothetical protein